MYSNPGYDHGRYHLRFWPSGLPGSSSLSCSLDSLDLSSPRLKICPTVATPSRKSVLDSDSDDGLKSALLVGVAPFLVVEVAAPELGVVEFPSSGPRDTFTFVEQMLNSASKLCEASFVAPQDRSCNWGLKACREHHGVVGRVVGCRDRAKRSGAPMVGMYRERHCGRAGRSLVQCRYVCGDTSVHLFYCRHGCFSSIQRVLQEGCVRQESALAGEGHGKHTHFLCYP